eukprot:16046-Heterococcus_DN1.PRE.1
MSHGPFMCILYLCSRCSASGQATVTVTTVQTKAIDRCLECSASRAAATVTSAAVRHKCADVLLRWTACLTVGNSANSCTASSVNANTCKR